MDHEPCQDLNAADPKLTKVRRMSGVKPSQVRVGDVVLEHGMRVRIDRISTYPGAADSPDTKTVYACIGYVLNLAEVRAAGIVPRSFLYDTERNNLGPGHGREDEWNVQGNDLRSLTLDRPVI